MPTFIDEPVIYNTCLLPSVVVGWGEKHSLSECILACVSRKTPFRVLALTRKPFLPRLTRKISAFNPRIYKTPFFLSRPF